MSSPQRVATVGELRAAVAAGAVPHRSVKDEVRQNLMRKLRAGEPIFPGIVGYDESVVPQLVNAILSRHNFILLGLRGTPFLAFGDELALREGRVPPERRRVGYVSQEGSLVPHLDVAGNVGFGLPRRLRAPG